MPLREGAPLILQYYSGNPAAYQDWPDLGTREPLHPRHLGEFQLAVHEDCHALVQLAPEHKDKGIFIVFPNYSADTRLIGIFVSI